MANVVVVGSQWGDEGKGRWLSGAPRQAFRRHMPTIPSWSDFNSVSISAIERMRIEHTPCADAR